VRDTHPTPGDLVELHFGEVDGRRREAIAAHVQGCRRCREELAGLELVDRALAAQPEEAPPADGLERVLSRIDREEPLRARAGGWLVPLAAALGGVGGGAALIFALGTWLVGLPRLAQWAVAEPTRLVSGLGLAALAFFAVGSFVTLALAPALLMESQSPTRRVAGR
jgi:hypothetical protein